MDTAIFLGGLGGGIVTGGSATLDVQPNEVDRYAPASMDPGLGMLLPSLIIEPGALTGAAAFPVTHVAVLTDGSAASVERARTILEVAMPTSVAATVGETVAEGTASVTELGRIVSLGVLAAMLLAGASLAIAVTTGLVERQRPFALLRLSGLPLARLRAVLVVEAAIPLISVAASLGSAGNRRRADPAPVAAGEQRPAAGCRHGGPAGRGDPGRPGGRDDGAAAGRPADEHGGDPVRVARARPRRDASVRGWQRSRPRT